MLEKGKRSRLKEKLREGATEDYVRRVMPDIKTSELDKVKSPTARRLEIEILEEIPLIPQVAETLLNARLVRFGVDSYYTYILFLNRLKEDAQRLNGLTPARLKGEITRISQEDGLRETAVQERKFRASMRKHIPHDNRRQYYEGEKNLAHALRNVRTVNRVSDLRNDFGGNSYNPREELLDYIVSMKTGEELDLLADISGPGGFYGLLSTVAIAVNVHAAAPEILSEFQRYRNTTPGYVKGSDQDKYNLRHIVEHLEVFTPDEIRGHPLQELMRK